MAESTPTTEWRFFVRCSQCGQTLEILSVTPSPYVSQDDPSTRVYAAWVPDSCPICFPELHAHRKPQLRLVKG